VLSGFWHGAATLSGRLDLSGLRRHAAGVPWDTLSAEQLVTAGLSPAKVRALRAAPRLDTPHAAWTLQDPSYPPALAALPYAPPVLFAEGNAARLLDPLVAIVGARACTGLGAAMARRLAAAVAEAGGTVVSGLAYGIDTAAHEAAGGATIAVLGQGLAAPMSRAQARLRESLLAAGGLVLSEFPPAHPASARTFPQRNRIIAGLARATVVVEAKARSGSLGTARAALDAGREVLAVPGHPLQPEAEGCLLLLAEGAGLVRGPADVLEAAGLCAARAPEDPLLRAAGPDGQSAEALAEALDWPLPTVLARLSALQLAGRLEALPGERYRAISPR
jgi:DNA processing protein